MVIIASLFCNVNCNYAFCKRGEGRGQEGEGSSFASCFTVSVSMVSHLAGKGSESKKL